MTTNGWHGSDDLTESLVPLDSLVLLPGNPRHGDVGAISQSLERFGQRSPIKVNEDLVVLGGNHTLLAAKALGWTDIAVTVTSGLEGAEQSAYALADNRLSDLATYDTELLYDMTRHVEQETGDLAGTGYDLEDVEDLRLEISGENRIGDERYTPEWLFEAMDVKFDVDLAAPVGGVEWIPADHYYTQETDALSQDWTGQFAWCNPPFSLASTFGRKWLEEITEGVWLGPLSHSTEYRVNLMTTAAFVWLPNEIEFVQASGMVEGIGFPIFLAGFGERGSEALTNLFQHSSEKGILLEVV